VRQALAAETLPRAAPGKRIGVEWLRLQERSLGRLDDRPGVAEIDMAASVLRGVCVKWPGPEHGNGTDPAEVLQVPYSQIDVVNGILPPARIRS